MFEKTDVTTRNQPITTENKFMDDDRSKFELRSSLYKVTETVFIRKNYKITVDEIYRENDDFGEESWTAGYG